MYLRTYLDAQCWITAISGKGPYAADLAEFLRAADRGELIIVVSTLMPLEVLGGEHDARTQRNVELAELALKRSSVQQVSVTARVVADARGLRLSHGLKPMDAVHIASAAAGRAGVLLTNDNKLVKVRHFRGVPIQRPHWPGDMPFDMSV